MPELPEVENVVRGLKKNILNKKIYDVEVLTESIINGDQNFTQKVKGQIIEDIQRRGKYIIIKLNQGNLLIHLRMTGKLLYNGDKDKHTHLIIYLAQDTRLNYKDVRKFGRILYLSDSQLQNYLATKVGLEPLEMSFEEFSQRIMKKKGPIKKNLLDQGVIAGIGNIYADEILFASGLKPQYPTEKLDPADLKAIYENIKSILKIAIEAGGSTIRDYVDSTGKAGDFQNFHKVYGRFGQTCVRCNSSLDKTKIAGRTTVFCPDCQKG